MKRMHIHITVADLAHSISFYNTLFGSEPAVVKDDYAKWMLDDPRINFAISNRSEKLGLDHLGIQVDSDEELEGLRGRFAAADLAMVSQEGTGCCYAESNKHWVTDPQGVAWEHFRTLGAIPTFNRPAEEDKAAACCAPSAAPVPVTRGKPLGVAVKSSSCC